MCRTVISKLLLLSAAYVT